MNRRRFAASLAGMLAAPGAWPAVADAPRSPGGLCAGPTEALRLPGATGWFARFAPAGERFELRAGPVEPAGPMPWPDAYACERTGRGRLLNPTLVVESGERMRIVLVNALREPSIVHWHGLANDTANDGGGHVLAPPGARYDYEFVVRNRAGLYWYHPHPHGGSARQLYRGLFGLLEVIDDEERSLRRTLDFRPGETELTLVLQDRGARDYAADPLDRHRGLLGNVAMVNGCIGPVHDVASRAYRLRLLNASNARTFQLGFRGGNGSAIAFTLIGTDGGLMETPVRCTACFVSPGERLDVVLDLRDAAVGDTAILETRRFDPMHARIPDEVAALAGGAVDDSAITAAERRLEDSGHHRPPREDDAKPVRLHDAWPEGAPRDLATFRVRQRVSYVASIPVHLSTIPPPRTNGVRERPIRLGYNKGRWRINDRVFAMGEAAIEVTKGSDEIWLLRNYHTSMPHAMHLHGFAFRVLERETSPDFLAPLATHAGARLATDLGWKDTVLVWPGESVRVAVSFATPFPGEQTYMFHCHNLEHEDGGMMVGVKVA